jgi:hypothetical protein
MPVQDAQRSNDGYPIPSLYPAISSGWPGFFAFHPKKRFRENAEACPGTSNRIVIA